MENNNEVNGTVNNEQQVNQEKKPGLIKTAWNKTPRMVKWIAAGTVICLAGSALRNALEDRFYPEDAEDDDEDEVEVVTF